MYSTLCHSVKQKVIPAGGNSVNTWNIISLDSFVWSGLTY